MKKTLFLFIVLSLNFSWILSAQGEFRFLNKQFTKQRISFELINNLIVIPVDINGEKLSFILDSGVSKSILFNITQNDSIGLNNVKKIELLGLGNGEPVNALLSKNNKVAINNIVNYNESLYVILKDYFDLSSKMGVTIHGILGYNLLKNFIVKINYKTKKIEFYNPRKFKPKKCKKCEVFPLQFYRKKPYITAQVQLDTIGNELIDVKLLVDSGGSDAVWLFEDTKDKITTPKLFFNDILGEGLSGPIYGNRSRISRIKLKSFELKNPTVSFLDSASTKSARKFKERNGSIGAGILKRFVVWFDYPNKKMMLKKNRFFYSDFNYNMSGLDVVYNGKQLIKEQNINRYIDGYNQNVSSNNSVSFITSFSYKFKPSFKIKNVVEGSPAAKAGLLKGDVILKINNTSAYNFTLSKITQIFQERNNKRIRITIVRNAQKMKFEFRLQKKI
ncbi:MULTISPECIES: aspartyl protease family protein [Polaribacter]|uniref:aspartyl protease family protein n=1 Tax=Polaribacter TaxID=52959 RepID=UPI002090460A|nr:MULTISPECIES: aspartyl protease family protein [Polaribacter]MDO6739754.1 aspartyl protease family protein [Polaribacter sp. 1_MG-2023]